MRAEIDTKLIIIKELSKGLFVSGQALAALLNISRTAVAKHIKTINTLGLEVFSVKGKGYRLAQPVSLLNEEKIHHLYNHNSAIALHHIIDSTNAHLIRMLRETHSVSDGYTVISECQTHGRGRRGRKWVSPYGSHVYLSRYYQSQDGLSEAAGLSLAIGIAVANCINQFIEGKANLKWPNDVLINDKKVAGVLVEAEGQSDGLCHLVIGIGVNINMPNNVDIDQPWTDVKSNTDSIIDRNEFVARLLLEIDKIMLTFKQHRLETLYSIWNEMNAYDGLLVTLSSGKEQKQGKCLGIDNTGSLMLEDELTKRIFKAYGGELSLRKARK